MIGPRSEAEKLLRRYRAQLVAQGNRASRNLLAIVERIERRIMRSLARQYGERGITKASASRVRAIANRIALEADPEIAAWFHRVGPAAATNGLLVQAEYLATAARMQGWQGLPYERVRGSFDAWQSGIDAGRLFNFGDSARFEALKWQWTGYWMRTAEALQDRFVEAAIKGESWKDLAKASVEDLNTLGLRGRMNKDAFSDAFTRTKLTEISNAASTGMAADAGIALFANLGIPDDRQSEICAEASERDPMTLEEWDATDLGRPPRHVFNCRCLLLAQPSPTWWGGSENVEVMEAAA